MRVQKETNRHFGKKALALFLSLVMTLSLVQIGAFALEGDEPDYGLGEGQISTFTSDDSEAELPDAPEGTYWAGPKETPASRGELVCEETEHKHDDGKCDVCTAKHAHNSDCLLNTVCSHEHTEDCYDDEVLVCTHDCSAETGCVTTDMLCTDAHHLDTCVTECTVPEHTHDDDCYEIIPASYTWTLKAAQLVEVIKEWDDAGYESERPASVALTVTGNDVDTSVELAASENWKKTVYLPVADEYTVTENDDSYNMDFTLTPGKEAGDPVLELQDLQRVTTCSDITHTFGIPDFLAVKLTKGGGVLLWTAMKIESKDRIDLVNGINGMQGNKIISYTYGEEALAELAKPYKGVTLTLNGTEVKLVFNKSSDWAHFAYGAYTYVNTSEATLPILKVVNTYTEPTDPPDPTYTVSFSKEFAAGENTVAADIPDTSFQFILTDSQDGSKTYTSNSISYSASAQTVTISNVPAGTYTLTETGLGTGWASSLGSGLTVVVTETGVTFGENDSLTVTNTYTKPTEPKPKPITPPVVIEEPEVPLAPLPEEPEIEIPEEEVPLAEAPETGDVSALWLALTALSGTGLVCLSFTGRKRKEEGAE